MDVYCDNYAVCNSYIHDGVTEARARAKGWHMFKGTSQTGKQHNATLCPRCSDDRRRKLDPAPPIQPGDQVLFMIQAIVD